MLVLFVYNTSIAASKVAMDAYIAARNLPVNHIGINFGTDPETYISNATIGSYSVTAGSFRINNVVRNDYDGDALTFLAAELRLDPTVPDFDHCIFAPYTPMVQVENNLSEHWPWSFPMQFARNLGGVQSTSPSISLCAGGRLGCPARWIEGGNAVFSMDEELVCRSGVVVATQAANNAISRERYYNLSEPLLCTGGPLDDDGFAAGFGYTEALNEAFLAAAQSAGFQWTQDLYNNYGLYSPLDLTGAPRMDIFAMCCPFELNGGTSNDPGSQTYSNSYTVRPGGWSMQWFSEQAPWSMDFLYNGGSAAFLTVAEPQTIGIRDPYALFDNLRTGLTMAEAWRLTTENNPTEAVNPNFVRQIVVGDPLYRPYAQQTPVAVSAPFPWT